VIGDRPGDVFRAFRDHISKILNKTITDAPLSLVDYKNRPSAQFSFRDERDVATAAPLFNSRLFLAVSQQLEAEPLAPKRWRLRTLEYRYHLLESPDPNGRWIVRWEYVSRKRRHDLHPRHHVHIAAQVHTSAASLDFDHIHLATGWVTVEEVIRFLIHDVGIEPKVHNWDELLISSEKLFREWTGVGI
jgi:hypothetical protein